MDVQNSVIFTGFISYDQTHEYFAAADIYVQTPLTDSVSSSATEAMACGLPIITTNIDSTSEVVQDNHNGFLFPVRDYKKLARLIIKNLQDEKLRLRLRKNGLEWVKKKYDLDETM